NMPGGGSNCPANDARCIDQKLPYIRMKGNETFKVAVKAMADITAELLAEQGFKNDEIHVFIPHQANERIIDAVGARLKFPAGRAPPFIRLGKALYAAAAAARAVFDEADTALD